MIEWYESRTSDGPLNGYNTKGSSTELQKVNKWMGWDEYGGIESVVNGFLDAIVSKSKPKISIILWSGDCEENYQENIKKLACRNILKDTGFYVDGCLYFEIVFKIPKIYIKKWEKLFKSH